MLLDSEPVQFNSGLAQLDPGSVQFDLWPVRLGAGAVQLNADAAGQTIPGDEGLNPTIAIDPSNPDRIVVVWEGLLAADGGDANVSWAYSHDGGDTWTYGGPLSPDRAAETNPAVAAFADGRFFVTSELGNYLSTDGGVTWSWISETSIGPDVAIRHRRVAIVQFDLAVRDRVYISLVPANGENQYVRQSDDGGVSFAVGFYLSSPLGPVVEPHGMVISQSGSAYIADGWLEGVWVWHSASGQWDSWFSRLGALEGVSGPNIGGADGPISVVASYTLEGIMASANPAGPDPLDVMYVKLQHSSGYYGVRIPRRVNDDPPESLAAQWFAVMAQAPSGRIDAVWYDTRVHPEGTESALFHSYSHDLGMTWSANAQVSTAFNHAAAVQIAGGLGEFISLEAEDTGTHVAFTVPSGGERAIYYLRVGVADCNSNGLVDLDEVAAGSSADCNANNFPDTCEDPYVCEYEERYDCDANGLHDYREIADDPTLSCGGGNLDVCEIAADPNVDCNRNNIVDNCEINAGSASDCNGNHVLDECEVRVHVEALLPAPPGEAWEDFGSAVAIDGSTAVVCAEGTGAIVYERLSDGWHKVSVLLPPLGEYGDVYCNSVAVDGDRIALGASSNSQGTVRLGSVFLYCRTEDGGWQFTSKLMPPASSTARMGGVLTLDGDRLAVSSERQGGVLVYHTADTGWELEDEIVSPSGLTGQWFGADVLLRGDRLVVSAPWLGVYSGGPSQAFWYRRMAGGWTLRDERKWECCTARSVKVQQSYDSILLSLQTSWLGAVPMVHVMDYNSNGDTWFINDTAAKVAGTYSNIIAAGDGVLVVADMTDMTLSIFRAREDRWYRESFPSLASLLPGPDVLPGNLAISDNRLLIGRSAWLSPVDGLYAAILRLGDDCDGDGQLDRCAVLAGQPDADQNGVPDVCDPDCNSNGLPDGLDIAQGTAVDCNRNLRPDVCDIAAGDSSDCNRNALPDECELVAGSATDCDHDGIPDACEIGAGTSPDCDSNGVPDDCEHGPAALADCNSNAIPDLCDLVSGTSADCDGNGVPDSCALAAGIAEDCDGSGILDACELAAGSAADCNLNGRPDGCDITDGLEGDCDTNGIPDACSLASGAASDCNSNGMLDQCDIAAGLSDDCNADEVPDECQLIPADVPGVGPVGWHDCNRNSVLDECDLAAGSSADVDGDGQPDECQPDCNGNAAPDAFEIAQGSAPDCDGDAIPDECGIAAGTAADCNVNGIPDDCEVGPSILVFEERFETTTLAPQRWAVVRSVNVDVIGVAEPSPPYALRFNGYPSGNDLAETVRLNLTGPAAVLEYAWQRCGDGESPDAGDDLLVAGRRADGEWILLVQHLGSGPDMRYFEKQSVALPPWALHDAFAVRFFNSASIGDYDDWLIDDIRVTLVTDGDCDSNGVFDPCDPDCDSNGIPDGCEPDCDNNGVPDGCDPDCDSNGIPDACEPDCDSNGVPDGCDPDCDSNGIPDGCEPDCDSNGIPDACDRDCDTNGLVDACEAAGDLNGDGAIASDDIAMMLNCLTAPCAEPPCAELAIGCCRADYDADGDVDLRDFHVFQAGFVPFCLEDAHCDDGVYCNGAEHCVGGACLPGDPPCAPPPYALCDEAMGMCYGELPHLEDFNSYFCGQVPTEWLATGADNSLEPAAGIYQVDCTLGKALYSDVFLTNTHAHLLKRGVETWSNYSYRGRLRLGATSAGIGLTFFSQYPQADRYYRLRRYSWPGGHAFHIDPHGTTITGGNAVTGITPVADTWYGFHIEVVDTGVRTEIRAKIWQFAGAEPTDWQIDCYDDSPTRLTQGTIGVWSMGAGQKYWDDLVVAPVP